MVILLSRRIRTGHVYRLPRGRILIARESRISAEIRVVDYSRYRRGVRGDAGSMLNNGRQDRRSTTLPLAPRNPLPLRQQLKVLRRFHTGIEELSRRRRTSHPHQARAVVAHAGDWSSPPRRKARTTSSAPRTPSSSATACTSELRNCIGASLFVDDARRMATEAPIAPTVVHQEARARLRQLTWRRQPRRSPRVGAPVATSTSTLQCRRLTMRALGRSVLGLDLDEQADRHRRTAADRASSTSPTVACRRCTCQAGCRPESTRRARAASAALRSLAADVLKALS